MLLHQDPRIARPYQLIEAPMFAKGDVSILTYGQSGAEQTLNLLM